MAASSSGGALKDLVHPSLNETLKTQNSVTFKLVKTGESMLEFLSVNKDSAWRTIQFLHGIKREDERRCY